MQETGTEAFEAETQATASTLAALLYLPFVLGELSLNENR